jgi:TatD DNase family protein
MAGMRLIDTHCHLDFDQYDDDREDVLATSQERMAAIVNVGTDHERNQASRALAERHEFVYATMGLHPTYITDLADDAIDRIVAQIRENAAQIQAVGEIGLDYHHIRDPDWRERQETVFIRLLDVAADLDIPVMLHTRDAEQRATEIVADYDLPVIQHCFNGHPDLAKTCIDRGYWISVSTQVLYSQRVQDIAAAVPLDRMLLETDAPFLYQGERNVPWNVEESAEQIAAIKGLEPVEVARQTTANAEAALNL